MTVAAAWDKLKEEKPQVAEMPVDVEVIKKMTREQLAIFTEVRVCEGKVALTKKQDMVDNAAKVADKEVRFAVPSSPEGYSEWLAVQEAEAEAEPEPEE